MSDGFRAGDVVVCVDLSDKDFPNARRRAALRRLKLGAFYRVSKTKLTMWGEIAPILDGVGNADLDPVFDDTWRPHRFRKIEAPKTEIAARITACKRVKAPA